MTYLAFITSQPLAFPLHHSKLTHASAYYAGVNYALDPYYNSRLSLDFAAYSEGHRINYEYHCLSVATITERDKSRPRFSSNPLITMPLSLLYITTKSRILYELLCPLYYSNARVQYHFSPNRVYAIAGQNTDLYLVNKPSKIYTESVIGMEHNNGTRLIAEFHIPWVRGYRKDRSPYLSLGIALGLTDIGEMID